MKWHVRDTMGLIFTVILLAGVITLSVLHLDLIALIGGLF